MSVKLILAWDILPERENDYFEFVIGEFIPAVQRLGLEPVDAWATIYGEYPQMQIGMLAADVAGAKRVMTSSAWSDLQAKLMNFVTNFTYKVVPARGGFQF